MVESMPGLDMGHLDICLSIVWISDYDILAVILLHLLLQLLMIL